METMIVIAIIGIVAAIIVPNIISWRENRNFSRAVREVYSTFQNSRSTAITRNSQITLLLKAGTGTGGSYLAFIDNNEDGAYSSGSDELVIPEKKLPLRISLSNPEFSTSKNAYLVFSTMGFARTKNGNDQSGSLEISGSNNRNAKITVDVSGNVRIEY